MKTEEEILHECITEFQGLCLSGEIEWETCIEAMKRYHKQFEKQDESSSSISL